MKPLFLDIDTQNDFVLPAGALYAPGAERILPALAKLNAYASAKGHLISTTCLHAENDPEFQAWPPHCIAGTVGQLKPAVTLVGQRLFEKQHTDVFLSPHWLPLLHEINASEYFVYGVVTEVCVKFAAEGLLNFGKPVTIVSDAIQPLDPDAGERFLANFKLQGGNVRSTADVTERSQN